MKSLTWNGPVFIWQLVHVLRAFQHKCEHSREAHSQHKSNMPNCLKDYDMAFWWDPPICLLKQPMRSLHSPNMYLCLLVLTAEPHFDDWLMIYSAMCLIMHNLL